MTSRAIGQSSRIEERGELRPRVSRLLMQAVASGCRQIDAQMSLAKATFCFVLVIQFLYWGVNFGNRGSISVLENQFLHWGINFCTGKSISLYAHISPHIPHI